MLERNPNKLPCRVIGPAVVAAPESVDMTLAFINQLGSFVAASVVQHMDIKVLVPDH